MFIVEEGLLVCILKTGIEVQFPLVQKKKVTRRLHMNAFFLNEIFFFSK